MLWLVPISEVERSDSMAQSSFLSGPEKNGCLRLYNKNRWETAYLQVVGKAPHHFAYIVESDAIPAYWQSVVRPVET